MKLQLCLQRYIQGGHTLFSVSPLPPLGFTAMAETICFSYNAQ